MKLSKKFYLLCVCICTLLSIQAQKLTDYVDPMIGSGGHGHVFVGASVPYGAVQVGPSNFFKGWVSGYTCEGMTHDLRMGCGLWKDRGGHAGRL